MNTSRHSDIRIESVDSLGTSSAVMLQLHTWGYSDEDVAARSIFMVAQRIGGQVTLSTCSPSRPLATLASDAASSLPTTTP